jgi:hypothetical protein
MHPVVQSDWHLAHNFVAISVANRPENRMILYALRIHQMLVHDMRGYHYCHCWRLYESLSVVQNWFCHVDANLVGCLVEVLLVSSTNIMITTCTEEFFSGRHFLHTPFACDRVEENVCAAFRSGSSSSDDAYSVSACDADHSIPICQMEGKRTVRSFYRISSEDSDSGISLIDPW